MARNGNRRADSYRGFTEHEVELRADEIDEIDADDYEFILKAGRRIGLLLLSAAFLVGFLAGVILS